MFSKKLLAVVDKVSVSRGSKAVTVSWHFVASIDDGLAADIGHPAQAVLDAAATMVGCGRGSFGFVPRCGVGLVTIALESEREITIVPGDASLSIKPAADELDQPTLKIALKAELSSVDEEAISFLAIGVGEQVTILAERLQEDLPGV